MKKRLLPVVLLLLLLCASAVAEEPLPLTAEDMTVGGLSVFTVTPADWLDAFGLPESQEEDTMAGLMILMYEEMLVEFAEITDGWEFTAASIAATGVEGPRGIQVEDDRASVLARFSEEDAEYNLQGTTEEYFDELEDNLTYRFITEEGDLYMVDCAFEGDILISYQVYEG